MARKVGSVFSVLLFFCEDLMRYEYSAYGQYKRAETKIEYTFFTVNSSETLRSLN